MKRKEEVKRAEEEVDRKEDDKRKEEELKRKDGEKSFSGKRKSGSLASTSNKAKEKKESIEIDDKREERSAGDKTGTTWKSDCL